MSFTELLIDTITVFNQSEGAADRYGNAVMEPDSGTDYAARVQSLKEVEDESGKRDSRTSIKEVIAEPACTLTALSYVIWDGDRYEVFGRPRPIEDGVGLHHWEFHMRGVEG